MVPKEKRWREETDLKMSGNEDGDGGNFSILFLDEGE